jgi:hypothetical protein
MIYNCKGCEEDLGQALEAQDEHNCYLATTDEWPWSYPNCKGHWGPIMVNDKGKIVMW